METMRGPILCAGAHVQGLFMRVDAVPAEGETVLGAGYDEPWDGGKVTDFAVAAARLGAPVRLLTALGSDARGERWRQFFQDAGIDTRWLLEYPRATDVGVVMLPPSGIPAIVSVSDLSAELTAGTIEGAADAFAEASYVLCSLESPQDGIIAALRLGRDAGATTILNPSPPAELQPALLQFTDILVPNEHEAAWLTGKSGDPGAQASWLVERFDVETVIVTAGAAGAYLARRGAGLHHVPAPHVESVVDTTGAGDTFLAALAVSLWEGDDLERAVSFAVHAASLSVTRAGNMMAYPTRDEVAAILRSA